MKIRLILAALTFFVTVATAQPVKYDTIVYVRGAQIVTSRQYNFVYVDTAGNDSRGIVGDINRPFKTVNAALDAINTGSSIYKEKFVQVGPGMFTEWNRTKFKNHTHLTGAGKPVFFNSITSTAYSTYNKTTPTKLVGGTIFTGPCWINDTTDNVTLRNAGTDVGPEVVAALFSGTPQEGLVLPAYTGSVNPDEVGTKLRRNIEIENWAVLQSGPDVAVHGILVEHCYNARVHGCSVWGGFARYVFKNYYGDYYDNDAHSTSTAGSDVNYNYIIKSNPYAGSYYQKFHNNLSDGGGGIALHNQTTVAGNMRGILVADNVISNCTYGIVQLENAITDVTITGNKFVNIAGDAISLFDLRKGIISGNTMNGVSKGISVTGANINIQDNNVTGNSSTAYAMTATTTGSPILFTGNFGSTVTISGANVLGVGNYYTSITGVLQPTPDLTITPVTSGTTLPTIPVAISALPFDQRDGTVTFVDSIKAYTTTSSASGFTHSNAIDTTTGAFIPAGDTGRLIFYFSGKHKGTGLIGLQTSSTKPSDYGTVDYLVEIYGNTGDPLSENKIILFHNGNLEQPGFLADTASYLGLFRGLNGVTSLQRLVNGVWEDMYPLPEPLTGLPKLYPVFLLSNTLGEHDVLEQPVRSLNPAEYVLVGSVANGLRWQSRVLPEYADNAAAITGGLKAGDQYRTGDAVKVVH